MARTFRPQASVVRVNGRSAEWLHRGFPWVYPVEVQSRPPSVAPGDAVRIEGPDGRGLGTGLWDDGWIAVRRFRTDDGPVDPPFLASVLEAALRRRGASPGSPGSLVPPATNAWRLCNAENDGLPGVRIDVWGPEATVRLDAPALAPLLPGLVASLQDLLAPRALWLGWRPDGRDRGRTFPARQPLLWGEDTGPDVEVTERGVRFVVRPRAGADAGLFTDMRDNRAWLDPLWSGRRVLNLFAYTGAFSVFAVRGGAEEVRSVDLADSVLARAAANFRANDLPAPVLESDDTFRALDRHRRAGRTFDLIVADPPSFSTGPSGPFSVERDLAHLTAACLRVLAPEGFLALSSNQGSLSPRAFQEAVIRGAHKTGRDLRCVHQGTQAPDFPSAVTFPEGRYLKSMVYQA
ncbi:MAG: class I SAM-dependent rRNA methyltransferase [Deltaproteobacteria bacterium]|nr:class I SAM-dependent rRNA methyltransferase [Deltaproteobacteria bacterium]